MNKLTFTAKDYSETSELAGLIQKIDTSDAEYVDRISDEIFKYQPFFLTVVLGYRMDISSQELEEMIRIYLLVWEYFKSNKNLPKKKVTQTQFEEVQRQNMYTLHYSEGESEESRDKIYTDELQNLKSKSLWAAVHFRYNTRPALINMDPEIKGITLIGILSFIQCFETQ
ncbi:hypothetical protein LB465_17935 [Salegentibacter sp. LM13S]|uniref:hypothetical protein n=1 Tax=Salegentibacter lacus TaxID=2873599 RepID=UPI001CCB9FA4|nr:hypothetical protein [Salegentibacter lacus]MBZ9632662.1 hypothetical protein [Salegentibacter lacus]